jgi:uncharacterized ferredoxin-like protein
MSPIPWTALLMHGPALVAAAEKLLARNSGAAKTAPQTQGTDARLATLEQGAEESARLLQQIAQQLQSLSEAQAVATRRTTMAIRIATSGIVVAAVALAVAIIW